MTNNTLTTDQQLTIEQRTQTIADIRRQYGYNKTEALSEGFKDIYSMAQVCATVVIQAPGNVTIQNIKIGTTNCMETCSIIYPGTISTTATITFANSGDIGVDITPTVMVGGTLSGTTTPATVMVPPSPNLGITPGTIDVTFAGVSLVRGSNNMCVNFL